MHKFMWKVLSILFTLTAYFSFGQSEVEVYQLYSDILSEVYKPGNPREKVLILDSTYLTEIPLNEIDELKRNFSQDNYKRIASHYPYPFFDKLVRDTTFYRLISKHNILNKSKTQIRGQFHNLKATLLDFEDLNNWGKIYKKYPEYEGYTGLTWPSIKNGKAVFILTSIQSGYAGMGTLILCKKLRGKWVIDETFDLWGT